MRLLLKRILTFANNKEITPMLDLAQDLSNRLIQMRKRRGEIDFDVVEAKVLVTAKSVYQQY